MDGWSDGCLKRVSTFSHKTRSSLHSCCFFKRIKVFKSLLKHSSQIVGLAGFEPMIFWSPTFKPLLPPFNVQNGSDKREPNPFKLLLLNSVVRSPVQPGLLVFTPHQSLFLLPPPSLLLMFSTCWVLSSIKDSHAPRGPVGLANACGTLRGNGAFAVGEEVYGRRGSRWLSSQVTCPGDSVFI